MADEALIGPDRHDDADAFELELAASDPRASEEFARSALEDAPWPVRTTVWVAHRYVLWLRLGPRTSPDHVFGWRIRTSEPDVLCLEATSPLLGRGDIVIRRADPTHAAITTYVFFARPAVGRVLWAVVGPLHRRIAPYLMEHAAARPARALVGVR